MKSSIRKIKIILVGVFWMPKHMILFFYSSKNDWSGFFPLLLLNLETFQIAMCATWTHLSVHLLRWHLDLIPQVRVPDHYAEIVMKTEPVFALANMSMVIHCWFFIFLGSKKTCKTRCQVAQNRVKVALMGLGGSAFFKCIFTYVSYGHNFFQPL